MNRFETLLQIAEDGGIPVITIPLPQSTLGLFVQQTSARPGAIILAPGIKSPVADQVLAEEIGHAKYTNGNILEQRTVPQRKQESWARGWGYHFLLSPRKFRNAFRQGCTMPYEVAEMYDLTPEYVAEAWAYYQRKQPFYTLGNTKECYW